MLFWGIYPGAGGFIPFRGLAFAPAWVGVVVQDRGCLVSVRSGSDPGHLEWVAFDVDPANRPRQHKSRDAGGPQMP
ncbi:hypothetical protein D1872_324900 [compost metagenome]